MKRSIFIFSLFLLSNVNITLAQTEEEKIIERIEDEDNKVIGYVKKLPKNKIRSAYLYYGKRPQEYTAMVYLWSDQLNQYIPYQQIYNPQATYMRLESEYKEISHVPKESKEESR